MTPAIRLLLILLSLSLSACETYSRKHVTLTFKRPNSSNAIATEYGKRVGVAITAKWEELIRRQMNLLTTKIVRKGTLVLKIGISPDGKIASVQTLSNTSTEVLADISIKSVYEAAIPPIPPSLLATLPSRKTSVEISFVYSPDSSFSRFPSHIW